ncbi:hypothetical protein [Streptomyces thermocarboxydovorans]|uniref:hypothetical protein n=1 Tax=Streptomyces thermocarboxydovorans TaxID=59298 RepID=UPI0031DA6060
MGGPLKKYEVTMPSGAVTTMKLNEDDARRLGVLKEPEPEKSAPEASAETTEPQTDTEPQKAPAKARTPRNKSRAAANKDGGTNGGDD